MRKKKNTKYKKLRWVKYAAPFLFVAGIILLVREWGEPPAVRLMEVTAYCACGKCCDWERGSRKWKGLDFWNRSISKGPRKGQPYSGLTASGAEPMEPHPGLFSKDSLTRPWMIPIRVILFPWLLRSRDGTVAADTRYFPFGARLHIPGYGYGVVQDRGGAIKGKNRLDLYFEDHQDALKWGRKKVYVKLLDGAGKK